MKLPRFGFDRQPIVSEFKRNKFCVAIASRKVNIYLFHCFSRYLSPYYQWDKKALKRLKENIILKWPKETFGNVFVFIELLSRGFKEVNPTGYFWNSEDYFEHLFKLDILKDDLICKRIFKKGKCIR